MRTRFHIEKRKDAAGKLLSAERPVFMSVTFGGHRVIIGTGVKVHMNGWDPGVQRIQESYPGSEDLNSWLDTLQDIAGKTMEALKKSAADVNPKSYRELFKRLKPEITTGFFALFYKFMESNNSGWSKATYQKVRALYQLLHEFEDHSGTIVSFQNLDEVFLERFQVFCKQKGYQHSTTYKYVNNLVWFLNWATHKGYNVYHEYRQFYKLMSIPEVKPRMLVFLHWDELIRLKDYHTENRRAGRVRDLFCFMCFAGVRFSELQRLKKEDLKAEEIIIRRSGGKERVIPMNKYALQIHLKYENKYYLNNTAFPTLSLITMNKYLRIIGKDLGLTRMVYAAEVWEEGMPLYKRLTAGTAVNTFIKNALEMEIPYEIIARFTGVQKDSRVRRLKSDFAAREMKKFDNK